MPAKMPPLTARRARPADLPAEVVAELAEAEALLSAGQPKEAARKARHSLFGAASSRAYNILTRAACSEGDLTNARATFQNVALGERRTLLAACLESGVDLR